MTHPFMHPSGTVVLGPGIAKMEWKYLDPKVKLFGFRSKSLGVEVVRICVQYKEGQDLYRVLESDLSHCECTE